MKTLVLLVVFLVVKAEFTTAQRRGRALVLPAGICDGVPIPKSKCVGLENNSIKALTDNSCGSTDYVKCTSSLVGELISCSGNLANCVEDSGVATCSASPSDSCPTPPSPFDCVQVGIFPDPSDCTNYYYCSQNADGSFSVDSQKCPPSYVFDPTPTSRPLYCRFTTLASQCITAACSQNSVQVINMNYPLTFRGQYVAACRRLGLPLVWLCSAGTRPDTSSGTLQCVPNCVKDDSFEFLGDNTKYYLCYRTATGWTYLISNCRTGFVYNTSTKQCVTAPSTQATTLATTNATTQSVSATPATTQSVSESATTQSASATPTASTESTAQST